MHFLKTLYYFLRDTYRDRYIIFELTKRDYKNKYVGSGLGFLWSIIQPFIMILVLWFVFEKGLKIGSIENNIPFIVWVAPAVIAWDFFASTVNSSVNVFQEYSYLVKKINFRISILPIIKILSSAITHVVLLFIIVTILLIKGMPVSIYWAQIIYYFLCTMLFLIGFAWIISSLQVFLKDISHILGVILQIGFWFTPVFWNLNLIPENYQIIFKLNPMFYIVEGYRRSLVYNAPFWEARDIGLYFWVVTLLILVCGIFIFKKLKPHFADVL